MQQTRSTLSTTCCVALVALLGSAAADAAGDKRRGVDFAGCDRQARVSISDFPAEIGELTPLQEGRLERVLTRIRGSFNGCGRTPGYDWIEIRGYAAEWGLDGPDPPHTALWLQEQSTKRATVARELLESRIGEGYADAVRFGIIVGEGFSRPVASNDGEAGRAKNRRVEIHLCRSFQPFHDNLENIEEQHFAAYAKNGDGFVLGEMKSLRDQLLAWSSSPSGYATRFRRISQRFWKSKGACTGAELLRRLERVRGDFYDLHIRPHEYELVRLREVTPVSDPKRSKECAAGRSLLAAAADNRAMEHIFRERLRADFAICQ